MQKYVTNALANYNFVYSGNYGYGRIDGYEVNVYNNPMDTGPIFLFSTYLSQMQKNEFIVAINQLIYHILSAADKPAILRILLRGYYNQNKQQQKRGNKQSYQQKKPISSDQRHI